MPSRSPWRHGGATASRAIPALGSRRPPATARSIARVEPRPARRSFGRPLCFRRASIPYRIPPAHLLPERTAAVLAVLYLLFNEGYAASAGADLLRRALTGEAIRLGRTLVALMPDEPEAVGLLALMLLHDARREGRVDEHGDLVPLEEDRKSVV